MDEQPVDFSKGNTPQTIPVEETPVIEPVFEEKESTPIPQEEPEVSETPPPFSYEEKSPSKLLGIGKTILLFIILFVVGFWLSGVIRQYINQNPVSSKITPTPTVAGTPLTGETPAVSAISGITKRTGWVTYPVLSGVSKKEYANLSFQLPPTVSALSCDGSSCASQGTYLLGGTRFTVALRGKGQILPDFKGKIISDAYGKAFTVKDTIIGGNKATEFTGAFTGSTVTGYAFSRMRGYMIEIADGISLEINHFTPSGIRADFESDDTAFNDIVESISLIGGEKGAVMPLLTVTPIATATPKLSPTQVATSAGTPAEEVCVKDGTMTKMTYKEAVSIATMACGKEGALKQNHFCNSYTGTWWIDIDKTVKGCNPACVVDVVTRTGEANYRCTGSQ